MKLADMAVAGAAGAVLAHTHRLPSGATMKKGRVLDEADCRALVEAGIHVVAAARLDPNDLGEDEAARRLAEAAAGPEVELGRAATGRVNVFSRARGVLVVSRDRVDAVNLVDESLTIATLAPYAVVSPGEMVATVKVIPFAVSSEIVARAGDLARKCGPLVTVAPLIPKRAGLVLTTLPGVRAEALDRAAKNQAARMARLGGELAMEARVPHDRESVAAAVAKQIDAGMDLVLVLGASAIVDRHDVIPRAIEAIGGAIDHFGMPVDPGNLLLVAHKGSTHVLGAPGCARSLKPSGFDWILERLAANLAVGREDIMRFGAGGLLAETSNRPLPRLAIEERPSTKIAAIVLAAGLSRRMEGKNKLLEIIDDKPIVARVVDALLASRADPVVVVVGHQAQLVRAALAGRDVRFVENPDFEEGLGASLRAGVESLEAEIDGALVALGDMPFIRSDHADALIDAFDPAGPSSICVPVHGHQRGHPVLWSARHFAELRQLGGDVGARALLEQHPSEVLAVPVDDPAIHLDVDTPDLLARARERKGA